MLSTTPYLHAVSKATAAARTFDVHAATLLKPRSVALTAMTEGPLQRILIVEFWVPHVFTCSGLFTPRGVYRISLSVKVRFSGKLGKTHMRGNTPLPVYARVILRRKNNTLVTYALRSQFLRRNFSKRSTKRPQNIGWNAKII